MDVDGQKSKTKEVSEICLIWSLFTPDCPLRDWPPRWNCGLLLLLTFWNGRDCEKERGGVEREREREPNTEHARAIVQIGREARTNEREMRAGAEVLPLRPRVPPPDRVRRPSTVVYPSLLTQSKSNYPVSTVPSRLISARLRELALRQEGARTQDHATLCSAFSWRLFIVPWLAWPPRTLYVRLLRSLGTRPTTRTLPRTSCKNRTTRYTFELG